MVPRKRGRDQLAPMARLMRLMARLSDAPRAGVPVDDLVCVAGFLDDVHAGSKEQREAARDQVRRDVRQLNALGWCIENVSPKGQQARYRSRRVDTRLRVRLTAGQGEALRRAVRLAGRDDLTAALGLPPADVAGVPVTQQPQQVDDEVLSLVAHAQKFGERLRFRYAGKDRLAHPQVLHHRNHTWYLHANEEGAEEVKCFAVARIADLEADEPGTRVTLPVPVRREIHPLTWEVDSPVDVVLRVEPAYRPDVVRWCREPDSEVVEDDGSCRLTYHVTNQRAFRHRLRELGTRVRIVGPESFRESFLADLVAWAGEAE